MLLRSQTEMQNQLKLGHLTQMHGSSTQVVQLHRNLGHSTEGRMQEGFKIMLGFVSKVRSRILQVFELGKHGDRQNPNERSMEELNWHKIAVYRVS